jgi:uncharacterized membrane protein YczE/cytidylate kinase
MSVGERVRRYIVMFAGVFAISFGIALLTKSTLGTSAISVIPYTISILVPQLSYGTWVALFNMLLAASQIILLRKDADLFDIVQQLVLSAIFGSLVDVGMFLLSWYDPQAYVLKFATLICSILVLAFGAYLTLISHVGVMAGDGFTRALTKVTGKEFGNVRVISDSTMALTAVVINLIAFGGLVSVREGTVVSALCTGLVVGFCNKHLTRFEYAILPTNRPQEQPGKAEGAGRVHAPAGTLVVTIAREYGSGGREIGRTVADKLRIPYYDSELIEMMSAESGFSPEDVKRDDQAVDKSSALLRFYDAYAGAVADEDVPRVRKMFEADQRVIRRIASEGSCVIVGRLANWILKDDVDTFDVFVYANMDDKIDHVVERDGVPREQARELIDKVNRQRAEHCQYCTGTTWGSPENYDIVVNSSSGGIEETGLMVAQMARWKHDRLKKRASA